MKIPRSVFQERWDKLVSTDTIRVLKIVEIAQYTILYFALSVVVARFVNGVYYEKVKDSREQEHRKRTLVYFVYGIVCVNSTYFLYEETSTSCSFHCFLI